MRKPKHSFFLALAIPLMLSSLPIKATDPSLPAVSVVQEEPLIVGAQQINPTTIDILFYNNQRMTFDFYGENIFRMFQDNQGGILRDPEAKPDAQILVDTPRRPLKTCNVWNKQGKIFIETQSIRIEIDKLTASMKVHLLNKETVALEMIRPVSYNKGKTILTLKEDPEEYYYGGGVQNGRFSHKGKVIAIENQNSWTDGGVASPTPYYWSTKGYGFMWYTFKPGKYDFGAAEKGVVSLTHETDYLDVFFMFNDGPVALLNDFYQLTGNPILLPKFGFYQGHLNAYNRDYWKEDPKGILFEDGKRYKESQKDNGGIKESLNGEKNNYQFSARAVIDRYKRHDMPFGWLLPNDGYGAGYGQTETLDGNIQNLKSLTDYAHQQGVEIGLWTQSDLHPKDSISALLQRDIVKEVRDAGVRVLKTDVAWVGWGYSFGLNGVADVGHIMPYYGNNARPFIISVDGWAGTQRYAGIWTGDQTGGQWEYIRFHIPTYIGSGLSGQPNITSDMDGIFGGKHAVINTRDFQWKAWTPMQLNMDGWGANEKYPHALGEPVTSINRMYLKMKSELMPYTYSIAREAVSGKPMIRAMFLEDPNRFTYGKATQYQFMYGPYFLVAPIYQETDVDEKGNDIRNGIYLPAGVWYDYFSGDKYQGGCVLNSFDAPLWKLPVFVKAGAIIPMTNPHNQVGKIDPALRIYELYPSGKSSFTEYDDDGRTQAYLKGEGVTTLLELDQQEDKVSFTIHPTTGHFDGFVKKKATELRVNLSANPKRITARIGSTKIKLKEVHSQQEFQQNSDVYYWDAEPNLNRFATAGSVFEQQRITKNPQLRIKLAATDITKQRVRVQLEGYRFEQTDPHRRSTGLLQAPVVQVTEENTEAYAVKPTWEAVDGADFYEIEWDDMRYTQIKQLALRFENLLPETNYAFKIRAVNRDGHSDWTPFTVRTLNNPLEFAIRGIRGESSTPAQEGFEINHLFDFAESGDLFHTEYGKQAVPFDIIIDLRSINQLDKFQYLSRTDGGNGTILSGTVSYSIDKEHWTSVDSFHWKRNEAVNEFIFRKQPKARYLKLHISQAVGQYGSGRELYVFKVPGTESYLPGDINNDKKIDANDLTSFMNYTGLRRGDSDFDYVSAGDLNQNQLIDAYDISVVTTQLEEGIEHPLTEQVNGKLTLHTPKQNYQAGELIEITVQGDSLQAVNAFSFALPYDQQAYSFVGIKPIHLETMENLTYDRLHTDGSKELYPTFVNVGDKQTLQGSQPLFIIRMKAKRNLTFRLKAVDGILVDQQLNMKRF